jgi:hypothetical protein
MLHHNIIAVSYSLVNNTLMSHLSSKPCQTNPRKEKEIRVLNPPKPKDASLRELVYCGLKKL